MSGASFQEVFLLVVIGLVVLGPKRLPQVANQIGSWIGQARRMTRMMKRQLEDEINFDLDSINVQKQLGLDDAPTSGKTRDTDKPWFAQNDQAKPAQSAVPASPGAAGTDRDTAAAELPDDYSPAHGREDADTIDDDQPEPAVEADDSDVADGTAEPANEKKETA